MIYILIENVRRCKYLEESETIRVGDNRMTDIKVEMPSTFGTQEYPREDCSVEMRCYISEDDYLGYTLDTSNNVDSIPVTTDLTEKVQDITISFVITHSGNVIGTTNSLILSIAYARNNGQEIVPREDIDRVINEQRQTIAAQQATIEEQTEQIAQDSETIGNLNTQVSKLIDDNDVLSKQNDIYLDSIDELNKRVPAMETLEDPVTPSGIVQTITPSEGYAGLASVTVDRVTAAADPDIQSENIKEGVEILGVEGTYNPFPEQSYGGIYITKKNALGQIAGLKFINLDGGGTKNLLLSSPFLIDNAQKAALEEVEMINCENFVSCFKLPDCENLKKVIFGGIKDIPGYYFGNQPNYFLESLTFSEGTESFGENFFYYRGSQVTEIILPKSCKTLYCQCFGRIPTLKRLYIGNKLEQIFDLVFTRDTALEFVTIEQGFNCNNLNLSSSTLYSVETIVSWLEALADRTGETAYTLTIGATNLNKLTDEQKAIAIGKNWNLA